MVWQRAPRSEYEASRRGPRPGRRDIPAYRDPLAGRFRLVVSEEIALSGPAMLHTGSNVESREIMCEDCGEGERRARLSPQLSTAAQALLLLLRFAGAGFSNIPERASVAKFLGAQQRVVANAARDQPVWLQRDEPAEELRRSSKSLVYSGSQWSGLTLRVGRGNVVTDDRLVRSRRR